MESVAETLTKVANLVNDFDKELEKCLSDSLLKIDKICSQPITKNLANKKAKRLDPIPDVEDENSLNLTDKSCDGRNVTASKSILENSRQGRPVRAAKLKVLDNLKEKPLNLKLRRPSTDTNLSLQNLTLNVKKEKLSEIHDGNKEGKQKQQHQHKNKANVAEKRKSDESDHDENSKKIDSSLEIVTRNDNNSVIELLSDDDVDKMPPPKNLPLKKRGRNRTNKQSQGSNSTIDTTEKPLKVEKPSLDNNNKSSDGIKEAVVQLEKIKTERESTATKIVPEKGKKGRKIKHKPIKQESFDEDNISSNFGNKENEIPTVSSTSSSSSNSSKEKQNKDEENNEIAPIIRKSNRNASKKKQTSGDSVYEDAVADQVNNNKSIEKINNSNDTNNDINDDNRSSSSSSKSLFVKVRKLKLSPSSVKENVIVNDILEKQIDATFSSAISDVIDDNNEIQNNLIGTDQTFVAVPAPPISSNTTITTTKTIDSTINDLTQDTFIINDKNNVNHMNKNMKIKNLKNSKETNNEIISIKENIEQSNDATFCINMNENEYIMSETYLKTKDDDDISNNSLITEDDSQENPDENDLEEIEISKEKNIITKFMGKTKSKTKIKNELFSPFVQSPVKKKVEAFEKHAATTASPIPQRQTRTKTRLKQQQQQQQQTEKDNKIEPSSGSSNNQKKKVAEANQKNITPVLLPRLGRILTPTQQSNITPTQSNPYKKILPSSTSKLQTMQKTISLTSIASSKGSSISQENGIEKIQVKTKLSQLAEEKKKLRDMKTQMVLKTKEARDRERQERIQKQLDEKAERQRKIEAEKRKHLEEVQKNIKMFEEAQRRLEKQKQLEYEKSVEAARKEREMQEKIFKNKEAMKMKFQQNLLQQQEQQQQQQQQDQHKQMLLLQQQQQQQLQQTKKNNQTPSSSSQQKIHISSKLRYDFNMLNSDDSTDDEGKTSVKRPQPPVWSKSSVRMFHIERQTYLPTKIIDNFFSVQPTTPNLKEIFPAIDPRYLKRNSSMVWKTPPRYSELPKY